MNLGNTTIKIDKQRATPLYAQLSEQIRLLIHRSALVPGDAMPTVRALAVELGLNANTVARVYRDLQREGLLRLERGLGTFVAAGADERVVSPEEYRRIEMHARELVRMTREASLRSSEVAQLIESLFKEAQDAQR